MGEERKMGKKKKGKGGIRESVKFGFNLWHDQDGG